MNKLTDRSDDPNGFILNKLGGVYSNKTGKASIFLGWNKKEIIAFRRRQADTMQPLAVLGK